MYDTFLFDTLHHQQATMAPHFFNGQKVWLKKAGKRNSRFSYLPLTLLARWLGIDALKPVPNLGGPLSIAKEAARIKTLFLAGVPVPTILAESPEALLIADATISEGQPFQTLQEKLVAAQRTEEINYYLEMSIHALNDVHARQCYLSEAFTRNILVNRKGVTFIDFETDPGEYHQLTTCMVRDWYCFIFSLYGKLSKRQPHLDLLAPALISGLKQAPPEVQDNFLVTLQRLKSLERFPFHRFGSDGKKIAVTLHALSLLDQQLRIH
ncbi:hypothetical protein [Vreelandella boliviensis]|uniref:Serine/threonine protein kinase n=1 Tax=Vreelandella boliviensis LC1 TaxID=1072583 RepID=A0A265DYJ3_9GAMM|nr:hypothetical protein [Halomonas boliviensis]EHJ94245.1 hypothetical protein KUC_1203 [Halomonas boliviensis LC1]OZT74387.1 hypothetical protein CE457_10390 [Halomonas boliviensis LC1]